MKNQRWNEGKDNGNLNKETVEKACKRFWSRLEAAVEANGDFFENI